MVEIKDIPFVCVVSIPSRGGNYILISTQYGGMVW